MTLSSGADKSSGTGFLGFLKGLAEVSILLGAGLFLVGWSYLYGYYRGFGLSIDSLSFSVDNVLVHSVPVITSKCFGIPAICVALALLAIGMFHFGRAVISNPLFALPLILTTGILSSRYANGLGRTNAYRDARLPTTTLPYVTLQADSEDVEVTGCSTAESNFRLLLRSGGDVFVVLPVDTDTAPNLRVCVFPRKPHKNP